MKCARYCVHHPVIFVIFSPVAQLCLLIILIIPMLCTVRTCKIPPTDSNSNYLLVVHFFGLSGWQSHFLNIAFFFLLQRNCYLYILNLFLATVLSLSTQSSIYFHFSVVLGTYISQGYSAAQINLDLKLHTAWGAWTRSCSKMLLPS